MKRLFILVSLVLACALSFGQTNYTLGVNGIGTTTTDITTCNAYIYDNGGENSVYTAGVDYWLTIHPSSGAATIRFMEFDVAETDTLYIYNGTDPNNDSIPLMIGSLAVPWVNNSNVIQVGDQEVSATIQNPTGALTLHFVSAAGSSCGAGFALLVSCQEPCQRLHANIDFANSVPTPHFDTELNDGYYYIDFCPGDTIHLEAYATYPDNDYSYHQDQTSTYFDWSFGTSGYGQTTFDYMFNQGQGYDLTLSLRESHNGNVCYGQTPVAIRVRGSKDPFVHASLLEDVCQGTEVPLLVSMDSAATIMVQPVGSTQESSLAVDSMVFIPDGPNCAVQCYSSSVNFTAFPPGATITSGADILAVRLNLEHEFIGDINISLICPNNRSVLLMPDHCGSNQSYFFGEPMGYNSHHSYDGTGSGVCDPNQNTPGTGWNYCWSENSNYAQIANSECFNHVGAHMSNSVDSSNVAQRTNYYPPNQSFSNLIGCPLNGLWQIRICDTWSSDNGYIFQWELSLDPSLMPQDWTYDVDITGINWSGGNIVATSDSTAAINTDQPGDYTYVFTIVDEFGCQYDHTMDLKVVQQPQFELTDQNICVGEIATLDPHFEYVGNPGFDEYVWNNGESTPVISTSTNGNYSLTINTYNDDRSLVCTYSDSAQVILNPQPIANFSASLLENCAPLNTTLTDLTTYTDGEEHPEVTLDYYWAILDAGNEVVQVSTAASPTFSIQDGGIYSVLLIVHTQDGCGDTILRTDYLTVYPQPISDFLSNPERTNLAEGGEINFINITDTTVFGPNDIITWTWNYGDGGDESHGTNGNHTYDQWGEYVVTLSVETNQGCASTVTHTVYIEADLEFPNVMTPNGDGKNDVFAIENMNPILPNRLCIYNRWGKKVYDKENYQAYIKDGQLYNGEQGFNADNLSDGVYYYTFHYEGYTRGVDYHGSLTILRDN